MKPVHEMCDEDLNSWISENIMGWIKFERPVASFLQIFWRDGKGKEHIFLPTHNLNHTHLMEEKIREMGKWQAWMWNLNKVTGTSDQGYHPECGVGKDHYEIEDDWKTTHASARHRCEAAWLVFQK